MKQRKFLNTLPPILNALQERQATSAAEPKLSGRQYRLVLTDHNGRVHGSIQYGTETITPWTARGLPVDLASFLSSSYYYEASPHYYKNFSRFTNDNYPIVYRDEHGRETTLIYRADAPCRACVTFEIKASEVLITRTVDGCSPTLPGILVHGHLLIDLNAGTIHPLMHREAWNTWETIVDELEAAGDLGSDEDDVYNLNEDEEYEDFFGLRRIPDGIAVSLLLFNTTAIRLDPALTQEFQKTFFFLHNGSAAETSRQDNPTYILDIPNEITNNSVTVIPFGLFDELPFPFSRSTFWILNPLHRSRLSTPMKAKKRIRTLLETGFSLLDESKGTTRNAIIRQALSTPDFAKRTLKREAKQILTSFVEHCTQKMLLIRATQNGWRFVEDDRRMQANLVRIMFELFGTDAFSAGFVPGEAEVSGKLLLEKLPVLADRLKEKGFSLRLKNQPLMAAKWEFALDATTSTLDWFELRPEIRCDGELLNNEELRGLLEGNGILHRNGRMLLLDEANSQVLAMLAGSWTGSDKKKRKGAQELVRVPRLQILDWLQLQKHGVTVKLAPEDAQVLESLLNFERIPVRPLPTGLNAVLRHYQTDAYCWLAFLYEHRFGACLADDMGLGKTLQGIALLAGIIQGNVKSFAAPGALHLVVAPPSLLFNWEAEIARFFPEAKVHLYAGPGRSIEAFSGNDIIITSYGIVQRDIEQLAELRFNVIIFDETQVVKNILSASTNAVRRLKGAFILALTGTPVENHVGEYYAIMDLCLPGLLGKREEFSKKTKPGDSGTRDRLVRRTRPFVLRRSKQMIADELPPKIETDIYLELSPKQKALYQRTVEEVRGLVAAAFANQAPGQARIIALTAILRLRQICLAPALAIAGASDASPKLEFLIEQLTELREEGHSALVFSQFTGYLDIIEHALQRHGLTSLRLDGSTPVPQRKKLVQTFQDPNGPPVFLISLKAGGKGLNLTRATYVYHMDPWWNPAVENQATDRAHRIGQKAQVTITRLIMRHTIEEKMMTLKEQKLKLYRAILEEGMDGGGTGLSREDFDFLLGLDR